MKMLVIVVLTLICFMCHSSDGQSGVNLVVSDGCCENFNRMRIPLGRITHVAMTPSVCSSKAIVFTAVNRMFCIDPEWRWAKSVLNEFQKKAANNIPASAPVNTLSKFERKKKQ